MVSWKYNKLVGKFTDYVLVSIIGFLLGAKKASEDSILATYEAERQAHHDAQEDYQIRI